MDVAGGDWIVGKAAASIVVTHPILGEVEFFNTHVSMQHSVLIELIRTIFFSSLQKAAKLVQSICVHIG